MPNNFDVWNPEIWSKDVLLARNSGQVIAPTVMKPIEEEIAEGDTVHFPGYQKHAVKDAADDGTENAANNRTASTVALLIDKHKVIPVHYGKKEIKQMANSQVYLDSERSQMGIDLMEQIESDLHAEMVAGAGSTVTGSTQGAGLSDTVLKNVVEAFDNANAPAEDRFLVVPVAGKRDLLDIDKFVKINEGGRGSEALLRRSQVGRNFVGEFYGINVIWTSVISLNGDSPAGYTAIAYHGGAVGLALQNDVEIEIERRALKLGTDVAADTIYGVKTLRSTEVFKVLM